MTEATAMIIESVSSRREKSILFLVLDEEVALSKDLRLLSVSTLLVSA